MRTGEKAIVYCNSRSEATKNRAEAARSSRATEVAFYHAGVGSAERAQVERYFREGAIRVVVATSAFGEGIDLPDVRHVFLYHLNFDFTEFNQQSGRAGRDGDGRVDPPAVRREGPQHQRLHHRARRADARRRCAACTRR